MQEIYKKELDRFFLKYMGAYNIKEKEEEEEAEGSSSHEDVDDFR